MESKKIITLRKIAAEKSQKTRELWEAYIAARSSESREVYYKAAAESRDADKALAAAVDRERRKNAALRQPAKSGNLDAIKNASKETVFLALNKDGRTIAKVETYATKSRTWGYTWRAVAYFPHTSRYVTGTVSGYGYCKESTTVGDAITAALEGSIECRGVGMETAWESFQDAVKIICKLSGKDAKYIKSLKFVKA